MRRALALALLALALVPAGATAGPPRLFVLGDSVALDTGPFLKRELPGWRIEEDYSLARMAAEAVRDLRARREQRPPLPRLIHVSSGTGDDPTRPAAFRRSVRRLMRVAGPRRCVVWPNIFHLSLRFDYTALNLVLAEQDLRFENLRSFDWHAMVAENIDWLVDPVHVNRVGRAARAAALAREVRACRRSLRALS